MPKVDDAKIKSARRKRNILYGVGIVLAVFAVLAPTIFYQPPSAQLQVGGKKISLEIASNEAKREKGLGGRNGMATDHGMIFVLDKPTLACFWMKGMKFPLDMVWLNTAKQVVYVQPNVSPKTYPTKFCPTSVAKYVIELNAGQAQKLGISQGKTLNF